MPDLNYDDGRVIASRELLCMTCGATLTLTQHLPYSDFGLRGEHTRHALDLAATYLGWTDKACAKCIGTGRAERDA